MRTILLVLLITCACGDNADEPIRCDELECVGIACGDVTPNGDAEPTSCTCNLADHTTASCLAE